MKNYVLTSGAGSIEARRISSRWSEDGIESQLKDDSREEWNFRATCENILTRKLSLFGINFFLFSVVNFRPFVPRFQHWENKSTELLWLINVAQKDIHRYHGWGKMRSSKIKKKLITRKGKGGWKTICLQIIVERVHWLVLQ